MYSDIVLEHFKNPHNQGNIPDASGIGEVGNPVCVTPDTLVYTSKGIMRISEIKKGDNVLTHQGRFSKISKVHKRRYQGIIYNLSTTNLGQIKITGDHLIRGINLRNYRYKYQNYKKSVKSWFSVFELGRGDYIIYPISKEIKNINAIELSIKRLKWDFTSKKLPSRIKLNKDFLYLVGFYLSEGYIRTDSSKGTLGFVFGSHEQEYVDRVSTLANKIFNIEKFKIRQVRNSINLEFYSVHLVRFFEREFGKGASNKKIPHHFLLLDKNLQKYLIKSLWQGDGYFDRNKRAKYVTISEQLAYSLRVLLDRQKIIYCFLSEEAKGIHKKSYQIYVQDDESLKKLAQIVGIDITIPKKIRNHHKSWYDNENYYTSIKRIEKKEYNGWVYNLEVERDYSYVTNALTLHNCGDIMKIYLKIESGGTKDLNNHKIQDIKFETLGCGAAIASTSILTDLVKGKTISEALKITKQNVADALGGLPKPKVHCSVLAVDGLKAAVEDYTAKLSS